MKKSNLVINILTLFIAAGGFALCIFDKNLYTNLNDTINVLISLDLSNLYLMIGYCLMLVNLFLILVGVIVCISKKRASNIVSFVFAFIDAFAALFIACLYISELKYRVEIKIDSWMLLLGVSIGYALVNLIVILSNLSLAIKCGKKEKVETIVEKVEAQ